MENNRRRQSQHHLHKTSSRSVSPTRSSSYHINLPDNSNNSTTQRVSRWQQLVLGASSAAGTTAAIVSDESMKCLKYCLSWLNYAIQYIQQQISHLQSYLGSNSTKSLVVGSNSHSISNIKKNIIEILRKVVDVVSKYAGPSLPTQAKQSVRNFILNLPGKWTSINDIKSASTSPMSSPLVRNGCTSSISSNGSSIDKHEDTAYRLLNFGEESIEMLKSVSIVFSDTISRAELWIDRIKAVPGISRERNEDYITLPPIRSLDLDIISKPPLLYPDDKQ